MDRQNWRHFDDAEWAMERNNLLREKGSILQKDFLYELKQEGPFLERMGSLAVQGVTDIPLYPVRLTEAQYKNPPGNTESRMFELWSKFSPSMASRTSFWTYVTFRHLQENKIKASFLASNGVASQTGAERIDRVLQQKGNKADVQIDDCVRSVLRQLGGLPQTRGNKSVFVDCPLARAWWRERLFRRAETSSGIEKHQIGKILRETKTHWEKFVAAMVS